MQNNNFDYEGRPNKEDLKCGIDGLGKEVIYIRTKFPKKIKKDTYILSEFGPVSYDAILEFHVLKILLKKPLSVCPTSGRWEGMPFLLITTDDFSINKEEDYFIEQHKRDFSINYSTIKEAINNAK